MIRIISIILIISYLKCNSQPVQPLELIIPAGHTKLPYAVNFSPDGEYILTGGDRTAKLWEAKSGRLVYTLGGHQYGLQKALFSSDNKYILTVTSLEVKFWELATGQLIDDFLLDIKKQNIDLYLDKFYFDGAQLHTYNNKGEHLAWGFNPLRPVVKLLDNINLNPEDSLLIKQEDDRPAELIIHDNKQLILLNTKAKHGIDNYAVSPNEKYLMIGTKDSMFLAWRLLDQKLVQRVKLKALALSISFSEKSKYALVIGSRIDPFLLNTENWMKHYLPTSSLNLGWAQFSDDEQYLLYSGYQNQGTVLYDIEGRKAFKTFKPNSDPAKIQRFGRLHTQRISPDNEYLLTISDDYITRVWRVATEELIYTLGGHTTALEGARLSPDGRYLVTWVMPLPNQKYNYTKVWDMQTGTIKYSWPSQSILAPEFSPDGQLLLIGDKSNSARVIHLSTGKDTLSVNSTRGRPNTSFYCKNGQYLLCGHEEGFDFWKMDTSPLTLPANKKVERLRHLFLNKNEDKLYTISKNKNLQIWSLPNLEVLATHVIGHNSYLDLSKDGEFLAAANGNEGLEIWNLNINKKVHEFKNLKLINGVQFSPNGEYLVVISRDRTATIIRTYDGKKIHVLKDHTGWLSCQDIHPNGKILATGSADNTAMLWDIKSGQLLHTLNGHVGAINSIEFSTNGNRIVTSSIDGTSKIWQLSGDEICTLIGIKQNDYICVTPDNYFSGSKPASKLVNWKRGMDLYSFEQFDLQFNRPDKVLKQLGLAPSTMITAFYNAYQTRLDKTGFKESNFNSKINPPELIVEREDLSISTTDPHLSVFIKAKDKHSKLDRINVWINDVPIYGVKGISLRNDNTNNWEQELQLALSKGNNKIQISALNQNAVESIKETFFINYSAPASKPKLYFIGIAIEDFPDDNLDLKYPLKDLRDFVDLLKIDPDKYESIIIDTLFNNEVSTKNLNEIKTKLNHSKIDDQVILFIAGHGVFDKNLNFYLATPNIDFLNPAKGGILYDQLEILLDSIPARNKLFVIDACHSGEIDKAGTKLTQNKLKQKGPLRFRSFDKIPKRRNSDEFNSFELMQQLFVDLRRGTGATVISSASGVEFAWESDKWNNSVFTYSLLSGLKEMQADANKDGKVMVSELQIYLEKEVIQLTNGLQQPTMRVENISNDWQVW